MHEVDGSDDAGAQPAPDASGIANYACLLDICRGDERKVADLLWIFVQSVRNDRGDWEAACHRGDWQMAGRLSHRLRSGFHRVDEMAISHQFARIESYAGSADPDDTLLAAMCMELSPRIDAALAKAETSARNVRKQWS